MTQETQKSPNYRGHVGPSLRLKVVLILGFLSALGPLSIDMYLPAFASIGRDFGVDVSKVELSLASFFIGLSIGQLLYGTLTDRFGRKKPMYIGLAIYILASVGCALASTIDQLIVLRFLQALGACAGMVISRAVVRDLFEHKDSVRIFSMLMLVMGVAPILAPLLGGFINKNFDWHMIFWIVAVLASLCLVAILSFLPESKEDDPTVSLRASFKAYVTILKHREFLRNALAGGFAQAGMFAYITASPNVMINVFGIPAEHFGWVFGSNAAGLILFSQINAVMMKWWRPAQVLQLSVLLLAGFGSLLLVASILGAGFWGIAPLLFCYISVMGITFPNATANALASQGVRAGSASALIGTLQFVLASVAAWVVSLFHASSTLPMAVVIAGCGLLSATAYFVGRPRSEEM